MTPEELSKIAGEIADSIIARAALDREMWSKDEIAKFLKVGRRQVAERYANLPDFPKAYRLPSRTGRGVLRWKASEIIAWAESLERL